MGCEGSFAGGSKFLSTSLIFFQTYDCAIRGKPRTGMPACEKRVWRLFTLRVNNALRGEVASLECGAISDAPPLRRGQGEGRERVSDALPLLRGGAEGDGTEMFNMDNNCTEIFDMDNNDMIFVMSNSRGRKSRK